jgi:hypothetical protein
VRPVPHHAPIAFAMLALLAGCASPGPVAAPAEEEAPCPDAYPDGSRGACVAPTLVEPIDAGGWTCIDAWETPSPWLPRIELRTDLDGRYAATLHHAYDLVPAGGKGPVRQHVLAHAGGVPFQFVLDGPGPSSIPLPGMPSQLSFEGHRFEVTPGGREPDVVQTVYGEGAWHVLRWDDAWLVPMWRSPAGGWSTGDVDLPEGMVIAHSLTLAHAWGNPGLNPATCVL